MVGRTGYGGWGILVWGWAKVFVGRMGWGGV